jgi:hypothetical protein
MVDEIVLHITIPIWGQHFRRLDTALWGPVQHQRTIVKDHSLDLNYL